LKLPFVKAAIEETIPLEIAPGFPPYDHQFKAFKRLTTENNHKPQSTLVTTGTSSGKTECFLYPILDHCYKNKDRQGIKIIILYPMNALATDQAKRLAETIWGDDRLNGRITAGLFIGEGKDKKKFPKEMGENHIIENRDTIIENPPDILLTNLKMLDYALLRNNYHNLQLSFTRPASSRSNPVETFGCQPHQKKWDRAGMSSSTGSAAGFR
jgi:DEAD/DEAH box helicase domain-containing protein